MRTIYLLLITLFLATSNLHSQEFSVKSDNLSSALIDIASQSEDMKDYINYVVDKASFKRYFLILQNNSIYIKTPKFSERSNDFINSLFSSYCTALGGRFNGGNFLTNETVRKDKIIYATPFNCFDTVNKKLLFKSVTDGSKLTIPTYVEVASIPEYVRKNLHEATANMRKKYFATQPDIGFFGKDNYGNYMIYYKTKNKLTFRYKNSNMSDPFIDTYSSAVGHINYGALKNIYPVFNPENITLVGDDCKSKDNGTLFIYPEGSCEITYNSIVFPNSKNINYKNARYKSEFGNFTIFPMSEE